MERRSIPTPVTDAPAPGPASVDHSFTLMGTHMRLVIGNPASATAPDPQDARAAALELLEDYNGRLSRFREDSELCRLNADPRATVPASELLRDAVSAALLAAEYTGGLVDPTLLGRLEAAGYTDSWDRSLRLDLREALDGPRPASHPAAASPEAAWRAVRVDDAAGTITRPIGLRLDTGGTGKGHAADRVAALLEGYDAWVIDCGGDLRLGGQAGAVREIEVEHPFTGETIETIRARDGAVATSGIRSRIWRAPDGSVRHHLLDPSTGEPAFTGLVAVTALAPTAVEAEALAKAALLSGPARARAVLQRHGGITVAEDGSAERIGRLEPAPRIRLRIPTTRSTDT
ncbi:unannotated protein [freshwater metagenome]|uniref:FAD:protein FMN transferase n=1 Tax=freshwater metagenome TaxID=449393 RepID=A0A6J7HQ37_9ZZZZ|nr:hypothetical protein [Actinomycetota bacterium]